MLFVALCFSLGVNAQTFSNTTCAATISTVGGCNSVTPNPGATCDIVVAGLTNAIPTNLISVKINSITHTWNSDLEVVLVAPTGERLLLIADVGGSGDNVIDAIFTDAAAAPYTSTVAATITGTWQPRLSTTTGLCPLTAPTINIFGAIGSGSLIPNGTWTLDVEDDDSGDGGSIAGKSPFQSLAQVHLPQVLL